MIDDALLADVVQLIRERAPAWQADGLCLEYPDVEFVPQYRGADMTTAVTICPRCLVRDECAAYGIDEPYGVWGGLTATERRTVRQGRVA